MSNDEKLNKLHELVRTVDNILNKKDVYPDAQWFLDGDYRKKMFETKPECFVSINVPGYNPAFLPICNRSAIQDPGVISASMKIIKKLNKLGKCDELTRDVLIAKLSKLHKRLDQEVPKSYKASAKKTKLTKYINKLKQQLNKTR